VLDEQLDHVVDVTRERGSVEARGGVEGAGLADEGEQLGTDALVDVALEVEGDGRDDGGGDEVDEGHRRLLLGGVLRRGPRCGIPPSPAPQRCVAEC
jgi:hypothetical protein